MFSTTKVPFFLASVVACISAVSAADSVFFSAPNCAGTQLQIVNYTAGVCRSPVVLNEVDVLTLVFSLGVPPNGAESIHLSSDAGTTAETFIFCGLEFRQCGVCAGFC